MIACVSEVTTLPASFAEDVANAAAAGFPALEVWLTKLEQHLKTTSAAETRALLAERGIRLAAASFQGGMLTTPDAEHRVHLDHFKSRLDLCREFEIPVVVLVGDFARADGEVLAVAAKRLVEAARWAAAFGVKLALEFHGTDEFCNNLDTAISFIEKCAEPNLGLCLDAFHYLKGPSKAEDLGRLTRENLFHVQVSDVAGVPREWMTDSDRVMPGDGDFHLAPILDRLRAIGYSGAVSVELMNPVLWQVNAAQVAETAHRALTRLLGPSHVLS
jgi:sugar phosphate isomerase/epimerase